MSERQGDAVSELLRSRRLPRNQTWGGGAIFVPSSGPLPFVQLGGARITLLSPARRELDELAKHWERFLSEAGMEPPQPTEAQTEPTPDPEEERARPLVFVSSAHEDGDWVERVHRSLRQTGLDVWADTLIESGDNWDRRISEQLDRSSVGLVLMSTSYLASDTTQQELRALIERAGQGRLALRWVLVGDAPWQDTALGEYPALHDLSGGPISAMNPDAQAQAFTEIARTLAKLAEVGSRGDPGDAARRETFDPDAAGSATRTPEPESEFAPDFVDIDAAKPFRPDTTVPNGSSIAFLMEFHDRALLIGGDSFAPVLEQAIRRLLAERGEKKLRIDAFVVPHNGSERNLNRELLELLSCDRYLISSNGSLFEHPDRTTIARIITYGRAGPRARPVIVFNYRTKFNEMWDDANLQELYRYKAVYPDRGTAGTKVKIL